MDGPALQLVSEQISSSSSDSVRIPDSVSELLSVIFIIVSFLIYIVLSVVTLALLVKDCRLIHKQARQPARQPRSIAKSQSEIFDVPAPIIHDSSGILNDSEKSALLRSGGLPDFKQKHEAWTTWVLTLCFLSCIAWCIYLLLVLLLFFCTPYLVETITHAVFHFIAPQLMISACFVVVATWLDFVRVGRDVLQGKHSSVKSSRTFRIMFCISLVVVLIGIIVPAVRLADPEFTPYFVLTIWILAGERALVAVLFFTAFLILFSHVRKLLQNNVVVGTIMHRVTLFSSLLTVLFLGNCIFCALSLQFPLSLNWTGWATIPLFEITPLVLILLLLIQQSKGSNNKDISGEDGEECKSISDGP